MLALIKKDLVTSRQPILIVIGLWVVQWITVLRLENLMTIGAFGTMVLPILIFGTDTSANGEVLTCSLPVRRASIVKARFVVAAILTLVGLCITGLLALAVQRFAPTLAAEKSFAAG
ncbi:MAG: ABC-2 transporter permease [Deltaproteobacteria bacterium]|nr:ABC-2 transporter permease [Deltaproteobacteria bacterium]